MKEYADSENTNDIKTDTDISETSKAESSDIQEDAYMENALEMSTMTWKERRNCKKELRKQRMADMTSSEKFKYIIRYYKWHIILTLFAIICIGYAGKVAYRATWPTLLELAVINNKNTTSYKEYLQESYREYYELDDKNYIEIYEDLIVSSTEDTTEVGLTMSPYQTVAYYNMYDMLDVIICDEEALKLYVSTDDTTAIDLSMDEELYKQVEDYVITMSDPKGIKNEGNPYTVALNISDTEFVKNCNLSYSDVYLLIPSTKYTDNENTINFIKYIYGL